MDAIVDERALLLRIAGGDKVAFKRMYDHYWDDLYALALPFLKSTEAAQDTVQEVFLKVWVRRASLPAIEDFHAYIFVMLRNEMIGALRKSTRVKRLYDGYRRELPADFLLADPMDARELETLDRKSVV